MILAPVVRNKKTCERLKIRTEKTVRMLLGVVQPYQFISVEAQLPIALYSFIIVLLTPR